jgi:MFS family permease
LLAVALLLVAVKEPERDGGASPLRFPLRFSELARLGNAFWFVTLIGTVFGLAHFSEAFLILRARDAGLPLALSPIVLVAMNVVYAFSAYPAGVLSDACDRLIVLAVGLALLIAADLVLAGSGGFIGVSIGVLLWGLHLGLTQGLLTTLVADVAPAELRGTAFGTFNLLSGLAALAASLIAGALWDRRGAGATFLAGAVFAALALGGLILARWRAPGLGAGHRGERRRQSSRTAST